MQTPPGDRPLYNGTGHRPDNLNRPIGYLASAANAVVKVDTGQATAQHDAVRTILHSVMGSPGFRLSS
jgi:hypothetical protein